MCIKLTFHIFSHSILRLSNKDKFKLKWTRYVTLEFYN